MINLLQIDDIAKALTIKYSVKFIGEKTEYFMFSLIVFAVALQFYHLNIDLMIIFDKNGEVDFKNLHSLKPFLVSNINKVVNLPLIGEKKEAQYIDFVVDELFEALGKGKSI